MIKWKDILHVFNTWLVANLLHPLFVFIGWGSMEGEWFGADYVSFYFLGLIFSLFASFPLLIIALLIFLFIRKAELPVFSKFGSWVFLVTVMPVTVWCILFVIIDDGEIWHEETEMIIFSTLAVFVSVVIRFRQFFNHATVNNKGERQWLI